MPYRTELKRPDLKGQFPCSVCGKVFCHSSSLSRHRMQAHFKSYQCVLCTQEIASNETLRSHMFRTHQISRMFMCRCCNWAFPDKTSLHIHMQSMMRTGTPGDVQILAKSNAEPGSAIDPALMKNESFLDDLDAEETSPYGSEAGELDVDGVDSTSDNRSHRVSPKSNPPILDQIKPLPNQSNLPKNSAPNAQHLLNSALGQMNSIFPAASMLPGMSQDLMARIRNAAATVSAQQTSSPLFPQQLPPTPRASTGSPNPLSSIHASRSSSSPSMPLTPSSLADLANGSPSPHLLSWLANNFNTPWAAQLQKQQQHPNGAQQQPNKLPTPPMPFAGLPPASSPNTFLQNNMHMLMAQAQMHGINNDLSPRPDNKCPLDEPTDLSGASESKKRKLSDDNIKDDDLNNDNHRSSIISNPYTSLLYRKKVNNVLRNRKDESPCKITDECADTSLLNESSTSTEAPNTSVVHPISPSAGSHHSDSQTSSSGCATASDSSSPQKGVSEKCFECQVTKGRLALAENRNRFLESKTSSLSNKISRLESHVSSLESSSKRYETEQRGLRTQCEQLEKQLLACQEKALMYMQVCAAGKMAQMGNPMGLGSSPLLMPNTSNAGSNGMPTMVNTGNADANNVKSLFEDLLKSSAMMKATSQV